MNSSLFYNSLDDVLVSECIPLASEKSYYVDLPSEPDIMPEAVNLFLTILF